VKTRNNPKPWIISPMYRGSQYVRYVEVGIFASSFGPDEVWDKSHTAHIPTPQLGAARQQRSPAAA
jgi:hypothetical protein